jgi:hypothetical protein
MVLTLSFNGNCRAYIVSTKNATLLKDADARAAYEKEVQEWIKAKVASHKYLRGGVRIVEVIPKRCTSYSPTFILPD